ncbi:hypothetical protein SOVF_115310 [Spinacia oleracea]|nr:hypothetical protein SOVF_115310 [Spinacia oleracea]
MDTAAPKLLLVCSFHTCENHFIISVSEFSLFSLVITIYTLSFDIICI